MSTSASPPEGPPSPPTWGGPERLFAWLRGLGLRRDTSDRWVAGVCSGIAARLGVDPLVVRAATLVLLLFGGLGVPLYALAWAFLPTRDGRIRAEQALRGDVASIVLLVVVALLVVGEVTDRSHPWLLIPIGVSIWILVHKRRSSGGGSADTTPRRAADQQDPPGPVVSGADTGASASAAPWHGDAPAAGRSAAVDPGASAPTVPAASAQLPSGTAPGMGPGRTWAPSAPPAPVLPRQRRPGIGFLGVSAVVGLAVLAYGLAEASGATSRPVALGLLCAVGMLGLALIVVGLLGRRASGLAAVGLAATAVAAVAVALPASVSWSSIGADGIGQTTWRPSSGTSATDLRWGTGSATLDLSAPPATTPSTGPVTASLGLGELVIVVPAGRSVEIDATVGAGEIVRRTGDREGTTTFHRDGTDLHEAVLVGSSPPDTRVTAHVGLGSVAVVTP